MEFIKLTDSAFTVPNVATIGFFDGVHRGHRFLIDQVKQYAAERGLVSLLITFGMHPRQVMQADYQPRLLSTPEEKCELLASTGADYCAVLDFTPELSQYSAYEFMEKVLKDKLSVNTLMIGYDHRFGHDRKDGFADYVRYGQMLGIQVVQARGLEVKDIPVSSSVTRAFLSEGEVEMAALCLSVPYSISGRVVTGFQEGRELGFPTANLSLADARKLVPKQGVYAVRVTDLDQPDKHYAGMLNIGWRPTMEEKMDHPAIEVHLLHYDGNLYGHQLKLEFIKRLRDERKFRSRGDLVRQLKADADCVEQMSDKIL